MKKRRIRGFYSFGPELSSLLSSSSCRTERPGPGAAAPTPASEPCVPRWASCAGPLGWLCSESRLKNSVCPRTENVSSSPSSPRDDWVLKGCPWCWETSEEALSTTWRQQKQQKKKSENINHLHKCLVIKRAKSCMSSKNTLSDTHLKTNQEFYINNLNS